jgi:ATP-dependent DNA helicase RecQ
LTSLKILKEYFHFQKFRNGQEEIIDSVLANKNVLAVLPTGAGKSLCYQIPALMNDNFSIVISPLISLMQDQVDALNKNGIHAAFINSSLDYSQIEKVLQNIANNKIKLLYLAPEKLSNLEFVTRLRNLSPHYLFIDEAHCISEWGHNFRPSYRNIKQFAEDVNIKNISAFTATATPDVRNDIIEQLGFEDPAIFAFGFERENIFLYVENTKQKKERILQLLKENKTPTIIYTSTRKHSEQLAEFLNLKGINAEYYHAGLTNELRKVIQDDFIKSDLEVIVATNAFGMGIDKQNIGMVIHYNIPGSIENLYQEFGRAGRNGTEAKAYLFFSEKDKYLQEFLIKINNPSTEQIRNCYDAILDYYRIAVNTKSDSYLDIEENLIKLIESKSINQNQLNSALTNLEQSGYLKIHSKSKLTSYFRFLLSKDQLKGYIKKMHNHELQDLMLTLVKFYGSQSFSQKVEINLGQLISALDSTKNSIGNQIKKLARIGIIEYDEPTFLSKVEMLQERVPSRNLNLNFTEISSKISHAKKKLDSVLEYSFTSDCRFKFILNYFGESTNNYKCEKCDNCRGTNISDTSSNEYLNEIIIRTFKEFNGGLTPQRLSGILKGKSKSHIAKSLSTYHSCIHFSSDQIENALQVLVSKNIIKSIGGKLFLDPIEELEDSEDNKSGQINNYESNLELFNKLREERNTAAKKFSQHPDIICTDRILRNLANEKPNSPSAILSIEGFNQRMFNKVGLEFLEVIKEYTEIAKTEKTFNDLPKHISQTYKLISKKYSLEEISILLKLTESIVSLQIETIIGYYPNENYESLIPSQEFEEIKKSISHNDEDIKEIKLKLPSRISYAKIRVVKSILSASPTFSNQI